MQLFQNQAFDLLGNLFVNLVPPDYFKVGFDYWWQFETPTGLISGPANQREYMPVGKILASIFVKHFLNAQLYAPPTVWRNCTRFGCRTWIDPHAPPAPRLRLPKLPVRLAGRLQCPAASRFYALRLFPRRQSVDRR